MPSARTAAMYGDTHLTVFTFADDAGILNLLGEGRLATNVETIENNALMDTSKRPHATRVGHTLTFDVSGDTGLLLDFTALAVEKESVELILTVGSWYRQGDFVITNVEEQIGESIRWSVTAECDGDLTLVGT